MSIYSNILLAVDLNSDSISIAEGRANSRSSWAPN